MFGVFRVFSQGIHKCGFVSVPDALSEETHPMVLHLRWFALFSEDYKLGLQRAELWPDLREQSRSWCTWCFGCFLSGFVTVVFLSHGCSDSYSANCPFVLSRLLRPAHSICFGKGNFMQVSNLLPPLNASSMRCWEERGNKEPLPNICPY